MRDALSLADQCLAFCGDTVSERDVYDVLGSMEDSFLFDISEALLSSNAQQALKMLDGIVHSGRDLSVFCADLSAHFRALLLAKTCGRCEDLLDCTEDAMNRYLEQTKITSEARLMLAVDRLLSAQNEMRYLPSPRAMLESALIHICRPEDSVSLAALEARVDRLESGFVPAPAAQAKQSAAPVSAPSEPAPWDGPKPPPEDAYDSYAPAPEPKKVSAPAKKAEPKAEPAPAKKPAAAPAETAGTPAGETPTDPAAIWRAAIAAIPNMFVQAIAREGVAIRFEHDTLTVGFSEAQEIKYKSISAPINYEPVQRALQTVLPEAKLAFTLTRTAPASERTEEMAKGLLGDKLKIE
jgi:DNA polymerase III gamma/tau subunit